MRTKQTLTLCAAALIGTALMPAHTMAQDGCSELHDYGVAVSTAVAPYHEAADAIGFGTRDVATITSDEWAWWANSADTGLTHLYTLTPPESVASWNGELIETLAVVSNAGHAAADGGPFAALPYLDSLKTQAAELAAAPSPTTVAAELGCEGAS